MTLWQYHKGYSISAYLLLAACTGISHPPLPSANPPPALQSTEGSFKKSTVTLMAPNYMMRLSITAEIADYPFQHSYGLMFRTHLDPDAGMLFIFETPQILNFWMKNTLIPLDILYFSPSGALVSTATMTPCTVDPCTLYPSAGPAQYALEVPAGYISEHGIGKGWRLAEAPGPPSYYQD